MSKAAELAALIGSQTALSNRNLVINGAMQVAQRGTSSTTLTTYATVDRFLSALSGTTDQLAGTQAQSTTAPNGFSNSYKIDCTTAETTIDADEFWRVRHYIEAQNLQHLKYGTSAAQSVTLSFYVRSNVTGTYACNIYQPDGVRQITKTYAISAADTWEYKTITFAGDTGGTINNDNGSGLEISWFLMAGSTWTGTDSTSWGAYANGGLANGHAVNMASSTSNEWYITGVQLEVGEAATPFEHEPFETTEKKCFRYFQRRSNSSGYSIMASGGHWVNATTPKVPVLLHPRMRAAPTFSSAGSIHYVYGAGFLAAETGTPTLSDNTTGWSGLINGTTASVGTTGDHARIQTNNAAGNIDFDAEL